MMTEWITLNVSRQNFIHYYFFGENHDFNGLDQVYLPTIDNLEGHFSSEAAFGSRHWTCESGINATYELVIVIIKVAAVYSSYLGQLRYDPSLFGAPTRLLSPSHCY